MAALFDFYHERHHYEAFIVSDIGFVVDIVIVGYAVVLHVVVDVAVFSHYCLVFC